MEPLRKQKPKIYLSKNNKSKIFYVYYPNSKTGKMTRSSTGTRNKNEAIAIFVKFKKERELKIKNTDIKSLPIPEFAELYKNYKLTYTSRTIAIAHETELKTLDKFLYCKVPMDELTQADVDNYTNYLRNENYKNGSIKTKVSRILNSVKYAKKNKYLAKDVDITMPPMPKKVEKEKEFLTKEKFLQLLNNCKNQDLCDIITVGFLTGMRKAELQNLRWEQVNWEHKIFSLDNKEHVTKTRKVRTVPLNDDVLTIIKNRFDKKICEYVFTYKFKKWTNRFLHKNFIALVQQTFGEDTKVTFHTLRHSFASNLRNDGTDISIVKELLGHADINTTMIYTHLAPNTLHNAVEKLSIKKEPEFSKN